MIKKLLSIYKYSLITLFIVTLWLPLAIILSDSEKNSIQSEYKSNLPHFSWHKRKLKHYFPQFNDFYNHHFGLRDILIRGYSYLLLNFLHTSSNNQVIVGKKGWFYYDGVNDHFIDDYYRGIKPFTDKELSDLTKIFTERQQWLKKQGIRYLLVIPPNKETIYPEYLPKKINKLQHPSRLDQWVDYAKKHSTLTVLYLRDPLLAAKTTGHQLYYKHDTHWNDYGAYFAYYEISKQLALWFPIKPRPISFYTFQNNERDSGDLTKMLNLPTYGKDYNLQLIDKGSSCKKNTLEIKPPAESQYFFEIDCSQKKLKTVIFRDSFFISLVPYLSTHFKKSVYIWTYDFIPSIVEKEKPDLVIQEVIERTIHPKNLHNPAEIAQK